MKKSLIHVFPDDIIAKRYQIVKFMSYNKNEILYLGVDIELNLRVKIKRCVCREPEAIKLYIKNSNEDIYNYIVNNGFVYYIIRFSEKDEQKLAQVKKKLYLYIFVGGVLILLLFQITRSDKNVRSNLPMVDTVEKNFYSSVMNHITMQDNIIWEDMLVARYAGKNQCNVESLDGQLVTVVFDSNQKDISEREWMSTVIALKNRLDVLEQQYAIGKLRKEPRSFVFKTEVEHMGNPVIKLLSLSGTDFGLQSELLIPEVWSLKYGSSCNYIQNDEGGSGIHIEMNENNRVAIQNFTEKIMKGDKKTILLTYEKMPYLYTEINHIISDGKITFDKACFEGYGKITEKNVWLVKLIDEVWNGHPLNVSLNVRDIQFGTNKMENMISEKRLGVIYADEALIRERILSVDPNADITIDDNMVVIQLRLELDETFPEKSTMLTKKIYLNSGFEHSVYTVIGFHLIDEVDSEKERARIFFRKKFDGEGGGIAVNGIFGNGRLEVHKGEFQRLIGSDSFYEEKTKDENVWIYDFEVR